MLNTSFIKSKYTCNKRRGSAGAVPLHPGLRAMGAQGCSRECGLAVVLPPLGDRPRGSPVWYGFALIG